MFVGFNVENLDVRYTQEEYAIGKQIYDQNKADIYSSLEDYIVDGDVLSADEIMADWFRRWMHRYSYHILIKMQKKSFLLLGGLRKRQELQRL